MEYGATLAESQPGCRFRAKKRVLDTLDRETILGLSGFRRALRDQLHPHAGVKQHS
jgi:hypothetical protein